MTRFYVPLTYLLTYLLTYRPEWYVCTKLSHQLIIIIVAYIVLAETDGGHFVKWLPNTGAPFDFR